MVVAAILSPIITGVCVYYRGVNELNSKFNEVDVKFLQRDLELEKGFVRKPDLIVIDQKIDAIGKDISEIKRLIPRRYGIMGRSSSILAQP
jgi:hypothetical protein